MEKKTIMHGKGINRWLYLEDLKDKEKVLFQPVFKVPHQEVTIRHGRVEKWLVSKIPKLCLVSIVKYEYFHAHFNFRSGAPPPIHQSTTQRKAFRLSSLPPLPLPRSAIPLSVSRAFVLCRGLLCTNSVRALSLSESVPDFNILWRKDASDEDEFEDDDV
jgi:hypothetical protein